MQHDGVSIGVGDSGEMADRGLAAFEDDLDPLGPQLVHGFLNVLYGDGYGAAVPVAELPNLVSHYLIKRERGRTDLELDPTFSVPSVELQAESVLVELGAALDVANVVL